MITRILLVLALGFSPVLAADPSPEDLLRQGLFEEEANRDLDKAAEHYRAVIAAHDRQRALAASATFRLGEIARKKNDKDAAATAFRTVVERFPEQSEIARLSRENLTALGIAAAAPAAETPSETLNPEDQEIARLKESSSNSPDLLDGAGTDGWRPMHHAAAKGWTRMIAYLLENKADPNSRTTKEQLTPLQLAAVFGHLAAVKSLLAAGADIDATLEIERCPETVLPARERKANKATGNWSALDLAVLYDRREIARTLIKAGADVKRSGPVREHSNSPFTTLQLAIYLQRNDLAMALLEAGAPVGAGSGAEKMSPLCLAVQDSPAMVAPLLKAGADPKEAGTSDGLSPLHFAVWGKNLETAELLIDAGADLNAATADGQTPLNFTYHPEAVELLVSKGANPNLKDKRGFKPLDNVAERNEQNSALFEALLKHGTEVEDAQALLKRSSMPMLPIVRERVVYPFEHRPDSILVSTLTNVFEPRNPGQFSQQAYLGIAETRPALGSPPPTILEILSSSIGNWDVLLANLAVVRKDPTGKFTRVFDWTPDSNQASLTDPPVLEWGDIVEVQWTNNSLNHNFPSISGLFELMPARSITLRIGKATLPRRLTDSSQFWLGNKVALEVPGGPRGPLQPRPIRPPQPAGQPQVPVIEGFTFAPSYFDHSRISVTRKGVEKPIPVDLTLKDARPLRLIDGDVIDLVVLESGRKWLEENRQVLLLTEDFQHSNFAAPGRLVARLESIQINTIYGRRQPTNSDLSSVLILRHGAGQDAEQVDLVAWLNALPDPEKWDRDQIAAMDPQLKAGDIVIFPTLPKTSEDDGKKLSKETLERLNEVIGLLNKTPRPMVVPPPGVPGTPTRVVPPPGQ
jgi:ankyrin repeat protein